MTAQISSLSNPRPVPLLLLAGTAFLSFYALGLLASVGDTFLDLQSNLIFNLPGLAVLALVLRHWNAAERSERWGWRFMAGLLVAWQAGDWLYSYYSLVLDRDVPFPGLADAFYYAGYACLFVALPLLTYPGQFVRHPRWLMDVALVMIVAGVFQWDLILHPIVREFHTSVFESLILLGYPLWDLGLLAIVLGSIFASRGDISRRSSILLFGMLVQTVTDTFYSYGFFENGYESVGNPLELGWLAVYLLIGLAALLPAEPRSSRAGSRLPFLWLVFPYLMAMPLPFIAVARSFNGNDLDILAIGSSAVVVIAFVNQILALIVTRSVLAQERQRGRHDGLTGVLNHGAIVEEATERISQGRAFHVALVDLDHLKELNDSLGHTAGDQALLTTADHLKLGGFIVGRYGGDEFLVLCDEHRFGDANRVTEVLRRQLAMLTISDGPGVVGISASCGIASFPADASDLAALIKLADKAMYHHKRARRRPRIANWSRRAVTSH